METDKLRSRSTAVLQELGIGAPSVLPVLEEDLQLRSRKSILDRLLILHTVAASAYGFSRARSLSWLESEGLRGGLSTKEARFLIEGSGPARELQTQVEAMWALAWVLRIVTDIDFTKPCSSTFVTLLPNLKEGESAARLRASSDLRALSEVVQQADLAYCLHWALVEARMKKPLRRLPVEAGVVVPRRQALDWSLTSFDWDEVPLDT
jgi:hypothetical protein